MHNAPVLEFASATPTKPPERTASGVPLKLWLIRAMAEEHDAMARVHEAADRLVAVVRRTESLRPNGETTGGHSAERV
jgi:hypothetical protein